MNAVANIEQLPEPQRPEGATLLAVISRAAADPNTDVEKMERLMVMYERIQAKNAEQQFNEAMNEAQAKIGRIGADKKNSQTGSMYATAAAMDRVLRPIYTEHGFSISYDEADSPKPEHVRVIAYVSHKAGHTRTYHKDMPADGKGAKGGDVMTKTHAAGSAQTYGMRYLLKGIFNIAIGDDPDDDDGNAAAIEYVTDEQLAKLNEWVESTGANVTKFLAFFKVKSMGELPARAYDTAIAMLRAKEKSK